ncbi:hypothetical protein BVH03_09420 [Pseudomonas sp. PA15(2017)]|uniref:zonular occludens toxin domain-containing protein n=1 Tax=Pseudomonas sp. PA15(2017) TaxID=1932111 RepID=UPI000968501D|nr:zonular occludens toxin domain-containing protein [Pseudomonas sp. PA15(2017)]OLU30967.1 hypothetical protein BVH03_09420 [Pseudomonas sp. PA15(2017)]
MINLMLGAPGGGKSYESVVYHVLPALNRGRKIITNLPLNLDALEAFCPGTRHLVEIRTEKFDGGLIRPFSRVEHFGDDWRHETEGNVGPLYLIDECHLALPLRGTDIAIEEWFSLHRHEGADVLLITQSYGKINKAIRDLVQMVYLCRKATMLGSNSHYIRKVKDGLRGAEVNSAIRKYEKRYFPLYRSHTKSSSAVEEFEASDVRSIWSGWHFRGAVLCLLVGPLWLFWLYSGDSEAKVAKQPENVSTTVTVEHVDGTVETTTTGPDLHADVPAEESHEQGQGSEPPPPPSHPFSGYTFFLSAQMYTKRESGEYHKGYVALAQNGVVVRQIPFDDLREAGYVITYRSPSVISVTFDGKDLGYVVSALPQISMTPANQIGKTGG